jgi:hypothetical protein
MTATSAKVKYLEAFRQSPCGLLAHRLSAGCLCAFALLPPAFTAAGVRKLLSTEGTRSMSDIKNHAKVRIDDVSNCSGRGSCKACVVLSLWQHDGGPHRKWGSLTELHVRREALT